MSHTQIVCVTLVSMVRLPFYVTVIECWLCEEHTETEDALVCHLYRTTDILCEVKTEAEETVEHIMCDTS